ncbi:MAG: tRNA 2-thiouridine(34) synthase MnmA [Bacteroidales bacterium]|jgi:tRNA-specific 2-thiouridylase|nr:tRNA 2-thiouridine(34) synthase MnmA [Bacteroidales bacterium]
MNIAALVSGGVDSSVVVHRLVERGLKPHIFYIRIGMQTDEGFMDCPSEEDIEITSFIARKYGLPFDIVPLHEEYWDTVVAYTIDTVKRGLTPNPDVMCNKLIKFGAFERKYGCGFDKIATGHYAQIGIVRDGKVSLGIGYFDNAEMRSNSDEACTGDFKSAEMESSQDKPYWGTAIDKDDSRQLFLGTAADRVKDQTYFLAQLDFTQVSRLMFPIGDLQKSEVRSIAAAQKLPSAARKDSQGICFLGKINYNDFIRRYLGVRKGDIVDIETGAILGQHEGFWFHTTGQRKGLGLSGGPWYVIDKNVDENVIYVARGFDTSAQYGKTVRMRGFRYITDDLLGSLEKHASVTFKIRHTPEFAAGTLRQIDGDMWILESEIPLQGIAPGQFAVVYDRNKELCFGSGIIDQYCR